MKWLFGTVVLLAVGLYFQLNLLVYAMYVLLGVLLINRFFTRAWVGAVDARRFGGDEVFEIGSHTDIKVAVQNIGTLTVPWVILEDALSRDALTQMPQRIKAQGGRLALTRLPANHTHVMTYKVQFLMRGYYQIGPLLVETGDVFGLHRRFRVMTEPNFALVMPKVLPLEGYNLASRRPIGEIRLAHRLFEDPTRIAGVRPYQHGDPLNRIHWRASARTGQWQSRQCESSCVVGATFLLDFHARSFDGPRAIVSAELAIVTVASLANAVYLTGQQIGFISNGRDAADRIREEGWRADFLTRNDATRRASKPKENTRLRPVIIKPGKGEDHLGTILATMARLEHTDGFDIADTARDAAARISRDTTVVAVLGTVTPQIASALGDIKRRGLPVSAIVVSLGMEAVPDWARPPEWAEMLLSQGIDFRIVNSEESISNLCAEAIIR
ncbi:MAG TPA: DUF58 domain-containing protein [Verrucomicrobiae bacterium]|jgi:uncharacterized protein (DUF58 family)